MAKRISTGTDLFRELRMCDAELVDKTRLIEELCMEPSKVLLLPRPRRFGKTLNLSLVQEFFARPVPDSFGRMPDPPAEALFEGLYIKTIWDSVKPHFQRYPTLWLNFKGMSFHTREAWWTLVRERLASLTNSVSSLFGPLSAAERLQVQELQDIKASPELLAGTLLKLTEWLYRGTGEKVLVLVDEYDAPIQDAWGLLDPARRHVLDALPEGPKRQELEAEWAEEQLIYPVVVEFFRSFFNQGLKSNPCVYKGILTGILRISKESIFSGLNNPKVCTLMQEQYSDCFGFTEAEVEALFERQAQLPHLEMAKRWYNGYRFGSHVIYNPWSIMCFLDEGKGEPIAHWLNSSANALIKQKLLAAGAELHEDLEQLMTGGHVITRIESSLSLPDLEGSPESLWSLMLFAGYLKAEPHARLYTGEQVYRLSIPNLEVERIFSTTFREALERSLGGRGEQVRQLTQAILTGNARVLLRQLSTLAQRMLSFMDGNRREPEALYQGLILGLCAVLEPEYRVRSNRESGLGRADVLILPRQPGQAGAVLELKVAYEDEKTLEQALEEGEAQVEARGYARELEASGARPLQRWVVAFDGKDVKLKKLLPEGA